MAFRSESLIEVQELPVHSDARGELIEAVVDDGLRAGGVFGLHLVVAVPGSIRGNHVHLWRTDIACVIQGEFVARFQSLETGRTEEYRVEAGSRTIFTIPANVAHAFANRGGTDGYLLCYSDAPYDPADVERVELFAGADEPGPSCRRNANSGPRQMSESNTA
jgi:dTDP-4-dehydrorhamnose 3,5-epimerase-like enzyme